MKAKTSTGLKKNKVSLIDKLKPDFKSKNSLIKILLLLFIITLLALSIKGTSSFLHHSDYFVIRELKINLDDALPSREYNRLKRDVEGKNIFEVDIKKHANFIKTKHPEFQKVDLRRSFPNELLLVIDLRKPFARLRLNLARSFKKKSGYILVDEEGYVLPSLKTAQAKELPLIIGAETRTNFFGYKKCKSKALLKALLLIKEIELSGISPKDQITIDATDIKSLSFLLDEIEIRIGEEDFSQRLWRLKTVLADFERREVRPRYIDLRFGDPIVGAGQ